MEFRNNKKEFRFEAVLEDGAYATLTYRWLKGNMVIMQTLVPAAYRGKGAGSALAAHVLGYAREQHLKVIIYCPFTEMYVKEHPEYNDLILEKPKR